MVGWHHQLDGHEFEQAPGVGDEQGSLACCSPWGCKESDMTERMNWADRYEENQASHNVAWKGNSTSTAFLDYCGYSPLTLHWKLTSGVSYRLVAMWNLNSENFSYCYIKMHWSIFHFKLLLFTHDVVTSYTEDYWFIELCKS